VGDYIRMGNAKTQHRGTWRMGVGIWIVGTTKKEFRHGFSQECWQGFLPPKKQSKAKTAEKNPGRSRKERKGEGSNFNGKSEGNLQIGSG